MNIDGELKPHRLDDFVTFYKRLVKMVEMSRQQFASDEVMAFLKESLRLDFGAERPNLNLMIRQYVNSICSTIALTQSGLPRIAEDPGHYHSTGQQNPRSFGRGESAAIAAVNSVYALALRGQFKQALTLIGALKNSFPEKSVPQIALLVKLAETCVQADIELLDGNLSLNFSTSSSDDLLERLAQHSPVESDFRRAILLGSMGELREAIRIVKERLITLKKQGGDIILVVRAWILLGQLHAENGQAEDGVQMLQEAILFAQSHGMQFYVAIAQRRLAYVKLKPAFNPKNIDDAEELIGLCEHMFDIDEAPCLERLLFHFTMFKLMEIRLFESPAKERKNVDALKSEAAKHLNRCLCIAKGRYRQLEKNIYKDGALFWGEIVSRTQRNENVAPFTTTEEGKSVEQAIKLRNLFAALLLRNSQMLPGYVNHWLL